MIKLLFWHRCFCEHEHIYATDTLLFVSMSMYTQQIRYLFVSMSMYTQQINYYKEIEKNYEISNFDPLLCSPDRYRTVL